MDTPPKRKRGRPKTAATVAAEAEKTLSNQAFFDHVAALPDKSAAHVSLYRHLPVCDNSLIGEEKVIDQIPADQFKAEYIRVKQGYGVYGAFVNVDGNKAAYREAKLDFRETELLAEMLTPGKCKLNLNAVLDVAKNAGYIKAWKAKGMWPKEKENQQDMADAKTATDALANITTALLAREVQPRATGIEQLIPLLERLIQTAATREAPPAAPPVKSNAEIEAEIARRVEIERQRLELEAMKKELEAMRAAPPAAAGGGIFSSLEKKLLGRLLEETSAKLDDEPPIWQSALREVLPAVRAYLQPRAAAVAANPATAAQLDAEEAEADLQPDESQEEKYRRIITTLCELFTLGKTSRAAAAWLVEIEEEPEVYAALQATPLADLLASLEQAAALIPEAAAAMQRKEEFAAWAAAALAEYPAPAAAANPEPPPEPAAPPAAAPRTTTRKAKGGAAAHAA
jgi:hypothetical protein